MFMGMSEEEAHNLAELLVANGCDEARVVNNEYGWSVQVWTHGIGDPDFCYITINSAEVSTTPLRD